MTCRDALAFLGDYLDAKLSWRQRLSFGLHLILCRQCRDYLDSYQKTIEASRTVLAFPAELPREQLPEDLIQAILSSRPHPHVD